MKITTIIYWISTALVCALMLFSAGMYLFNYDMVTTFFTILGYPIYIIYPLAIAKLLAIVAILSKQSKVLKEWAYAGLFFDFVLAAAAHLAVQDGGHWTPIMAIILLLVSRVTEDLVFKRR